MSTTKPIRRAAIIGTGVIGASWAALFLANGLEVAATDVAPNAETALRRFIKDAWPAFERLGLAPGASQSKLTFTADLATAVKNADLIQENGPERIEFKTKLYGQLDELLPPDVIIASSSSGLTMSEIQQGCSAHPERCVIGHPFNPPHLMPLVEIVGGAKTSEETIRRVTDFYASMGKRPVRLHKELPGHVANRLQAALSREVYHLVAEGVVSAADAEIVMSDTLIMSRSREQLSVTVEELRARPRVVIIGGGFAGIAAAKALRRCDADVVVIDRRNHHIFQPLLYQVATAVLAPSDVGAPIRQLAARQDNVPVILGEVVGVDLEAKSVEADCPGVGIKKIGFDYLVVATGMQSSYFGHDEFGQYAPCLKTITDAEAIRTKILAAYELAESTEDADERQRQITFVLVGAGPTGVELAASIAQMATTTLRGNFRHIDPASTSIILLEDGKRVLPTFAESLSNKVAKRLAKLGVQVATGAMVERIDDRDAWRGSSGL